MSNVVIDIAAEFTGKKAFKQADSAAGKLNSSIKKLAGTFGIAFGAQALVQFGKAAVKAFAEDEAAANRLAGAVNNLGIGFANPAIADYIAKLEKSAAVADDILRPAFQGLLTTTGSLTQSQKLLNDAITISRASGIDLATVTDDLGKGYIGITKGLTKYNTGLTRAELQSKSFSEILGVILANSAGAAEDYLTTTSYKMDVLSIATSNASEIIGEGFVDALARASGGTEASDAAVFLETMAGLFNKLTLAAGTSIGAIPTLAQNLKKLGKDIFFGFVGKQAGVTLTAPENKTEKKLTLSEKKQQELLAKFEKDSLRREKERLALLNKQNTAKKLQGLIDKANLALAKGTDVFDLDKIQLNAAMVNQAEQLGKVTSQSQLLMITNDMTRLKIKQDIANLEDAIASKDEARIIAATKQLNQDLKILGALQNQDIKLADIKSILDKITPKDLINQANLDAALAKIKEMMDLLAKMNNGKTGGSTTGGGNEPSAFEKYVAKLPVDTSTADMFANLKSDTEWWKKNGDFFGGFVPFVGANIPSAATMDFGGSGAGLGNNGSGRQVPMGVDITINTGVGDPNAIAEALDQYLQGAVDRGTLRLR
jgi:hypothetical protein